MVTSYLRRVDDNWVCAKTNRAVLGQTLRIAQATFDHLQSRDFPCPMAQAACAQNDVSISVRKSMDLQTCLKAVSEDLDAWQDTPSNGDFRSFVAMFSDDRPANHEAFHTLLWRALAGLRRCESAPLDQPEGTSRDIHSPNFALCLHGCAYFVVGLTPVSRRLSRRTPFSGFALNPHSQFETLRRTGQMGRISEISRRKDRLLQGDTNPLLAAHGEASAALQYSGFPARKLPEWE